MKRLARGFKFIKILSRVLRLRRIIIESSVKLNFQFALNPQQQNQQLLQHRKQHQQQPLLFPFLFRGFQNQLLQHPFYFYDHLVAFYIFHHSFALFLFSILSPSLSISPSILFQSHPLFFCSYSLYSLLICLSIGLLSPSSIKVLFFSISLSVFTASTFPIVGMPHFHH